MHRRTFLTGVSGLAATGAALAGGASATDSIRTTSNTLPRKVVIGTAIQDLDHTEEEAALPAPPPTRRGSGIGGLWPRRFWTSEGSNAPSLAAVMVNTFNITQDRIMRSRLAGDPPDVLVTLKVGKVGLFEFHRAEELIAMGRAAVRRSSDEILELLEGALAGT